MPSYPNSAQLIDMAGGYLDNRRGSDWLIVNLCKTRTKNCLQAEFLFSEVPCQKAEIYSTCELTYAFPIGY